MSLLRPIRTKEPAGDVRRRAAWLRIRKRAAPLKDAVVRGVTEIESDEHLAARETFRAARDSWHAGEQKPRPDARGD
jgi:hypothetical protein